MNMFNEEGDTVFPLLNLILRAAGRIINPFMYRKVREGTSSIPDKRAWLKLVRRLLSDVSRQSTPCEYSEYSEYPIGVPHATVPLIFLLYSECLQCDVRQALLSCAIPVSVGSGCADATA
jgi:hypothetical protein